MTLTINLPPAMIQKLQAEAAASGKDLDTFVRETMEVRLAIAGRSFRDIMKPVHEDFRRSGMTDAELDTLIDDAVIEARAERKASRQQP
jgi:hypothetical protein